MLYIFFSLLFASLLKYIIREKFLLPYSFLLLLFGILSSILNHYFQYKPLSESISQLQSISPNNILLLFIPPLIYHSATKINFHIIRQYILQISILIIPVILINFIICGIFNHWITSLSWIDSFILGVIISATDPVSIASILEDLHISEKIRVLIEGESLFNDGSVYIIFELLMHWYDESITTIVLKTLYIPICSILLGIGFGVLQFIILRKIHNVPNIEITISIMFCYIVFYISNESYLSGIISVVILGLCISAGGKTAYSSSSQNSLKHVWEIIDFITNNLIFIISGLIIGNIGEYSFKKWGIMFMMYFVLNIIRFVSIFIFYKWLKIDLYQIYHHQWCIIALSGMKGGITLVLALITQNADILFYSAGIVFLSIPLNTMMVKFYITHILKHVYRNRVEKILHIRDKLYTVGQISIEKIQTNFFLKNVAWETVHNKIIREIDMELPRIHSSRDIIIEKRLIYLKTFKQTLWSLFAKNMLYKDTIIKLIEILDTTIDSEEKILSILHIPTLINTKWFTYHDINHKYNFFSAFLLGQKYTMDNLKNIISQDDFDMLVEEIIPSMNYSLEFLRKIENDYPLITEKIETRQTIHYILKNQQVYLKKLFKDGEINYYIYNEINKEINQKLNFD